LGNLEHPGDEAVSGRLKESLTDMAPQQRLVLLLTVLEGFTVSDAARILGIGTDAAERSLEEARRELQRVAAVRVLVIEDEAVIALDVADLVRGAGHQVVGIAATEKAAIELAKKHSPHLILADIQLRGSDSGIAAVNEIMRSMKVPVIYVTQYPERLLTGKHVEAAFVISKPFDPDLLRAAIAQALDTVSVTI
jgi:CheY-like chemotaxis protein